MSSLLNIFETDSFHANNTNYQGVNKPRNITKTAPKVSPDIRFKPVNLPKLNILGNTLKSLPVVATVLPLANSLADMYNQKFVKLLLKNPDWRPDDKFKASYPDLTEYANAVINNREQENKRLNLEKQQKEYEADVANYIKYMSYDNSVPISDDDMINLKRASLENYPDLKKAIGNSLPPYTNGIPSSPSRSGYHIAGTSPDPANPNDLYTHNVPTPDIPLGTATKPPAAPSSAFPPPSKNLLSVMEDNNTLLIKAMDKHNNRIVSALKGEPDTPLSSDKPLETKTPDPLVPESMPEVGVPYEDENGVNLVLGEDGITRMISPNMAKFNQVDYNRDVDKLLRANLNPRPVKGYEFSDTPFTSKYLAKVANEQELYDKEYGTQEELSNIRKKYAYKNSDIEKAFEKSSIAVPPPNVVPFSPADFVAPANQSVGSTNDSSSPSVSVTLPKSVKEEKLIDLQIASLEFDNTPLTIPDIGDSIPAISPKEMVAIKNAHVAKKHSDENTFEVDDDDLDDMFGGNLPDISSIFKRDSKLDRWQNALKEYKDSLV